MTVTYPMPPGGAWDGGGRPDDEIYRHDKRWLGAAPYTLPFPIPFRSIAVALGAFVPALILMRAVGLSGPLVYLLDLGVSCAAAAAAARFTGPERSLSALVMILFHEVSAPRPPRTTPQPETETLRPGVVPVTGAPAAPGSSRTATP